MLVSELGWILELVERQGLLVLIWSLNPHNVIG